jgi:hypothetical protein
VDVVGGLRVEADPAGPLTNSVVRKSYVDIG